MLNKQKAEIILNHAAILANHYNDYTTKSGIKLFDGASDEKKQLFFQVLIELNHNNNRQVIQYKNEFRDCSSGIMKLDIEISNLKHAINERKSELATNGKIKPVSQHSSTKGKKVLFGYTGNSITANDSITKNLIEQLHIKEQQREQLVERQGELKVLIQKGESEQINIVIFDGAAQAAGMSPDKVPDSDKQEFFQDIISNEKVVDMEVKLNELDENLDLASAESDRILTDRELEFDDDILADFGLDILDEDNDSPAPIRP